MDKVKKSRGSNLAERREEDAEEHNESLKGLSVIHWSCTDIG